MSCGPQQKSSTVEGSTASKCRKSSFIGRVHTNVTCSRRLFRLKGWTCTQDAPRANYPRDVVPLISCVRTASGLRTYK